MPGTEDGRKVTKPVELHLVKTRTGFYLPLTVGAKTVLFLVDTGAWWTLMKLALVKECGLGDAITELDKDVMGIFGIVEAVAVAEGGYVLNFVVAVGYQLHTPLLGMNFLLRYGCLLVLDPEWPHLTVRPARKIKMSLFCSVYKRCLLAGHRVTAILDTGSTHCFISQALAKECKLKRKFCCPLLGKMYDGRVFVACRKIKRAEVNIDGLRYSTDLIIHPRLNIPFLLGMNVLAGSTLCFKKKKIALSDANPIYVAGEQDPKPSSFSFRPPQFYTLSSSGRYISSATGTGKKRGFPLFRKLRKLLGRCCCGHEEETKESWNDSQPPTRTLSGREVETDSQPLTRTLCGSEVQTDSQLPTRTLSGSEVQTDSQPPTGTLRGRQVETEAETGEKEESDSGQEHGSDKLSPNSQR